MPGGRTSPKVACRRWRLRHLSSSRAPLTRFSTSDRALSECCHQNSKWAPAEPGVTPGSAADQAKATASVRAARPARPSLERAPSRAWPSSAMVGALPSMASSRVDRCSRAFVTLSGSILLCALSSRSSEESQVCTCRSVWRPAPMVPSASQAARADSTTWSPNLVGGHSASSHWRPAASMTAGDAPPAPQAAATAPSATPASASSAPAKGPRAHSALRRPRGSDRSARVSSAAERARLPAPSWGSAVVPALASSSSRGATAAASRRLASPSSRHARTAASTCSACRGSCCASDATRLSAAASAARAGFRPGPTSRSTASASFSCGGGASAGGQSWPPRSASAVLMVKVFRPSIGPARRSRAQPCVSSRSFSSMGARTSSATPSPERCVPDRAVGPGGSPVIPRCSSDSAIPCGNSVSAKLRRTQSSRSRSNCSAEASAAKPSDTSLRSWTRMSGYGRDGRDSSSSRTSAPRATPTVAKAFRINLPTSSKRSRVSPSSVRSADRTAARPKSSPGSARSTRPSRTRTSKRSICGDISGVEAQIAAATHSVRSSGGSLMSRRDTARTRARTLFIMMIAS
mmetsp:Transcript_11629/g.37101  ORF Transcript_11629/g.37101 Transcript_11629/m.37101 type:complete len:577 (+) Transcript_11629:584-2314(+)